ncbi:hypothetical protein DEO72_LG4g2572 [Vigna unguiculata]|uniref:Uncharacterized protein n=1 Tax=Vigna unguiculata TaxID=3917 RepID=A0A4D6LU88_VIGUN|nr:hypothetical protein DEO72_LG4g2572 [Vigna unguiculata]
MEKGRERMLRRLGRTTVWRRKGCCGGRGKQLWKRGRRGRGGRRRMKSVWRCGGCVHEKREKEDEECVEVWRLCAREEGEGG